MTILFEDSYRTYRTQYEIKIAYVKFASSPAVCEVVIYVRISLQHIFPDD